MRRGENNFVTKIQLQNAASQTTNHPRQGGDEKRRRRAGDNWNWDRKVASARDKGRRALAKQTWDEMGKSGAIVRHSRKVALTKPDT
ncbi:uncharacterized protein SPSK_04734 [Sporothrix schenckii 1099-18]|uniref:Uncharacterized protein n=1 Tax=Sporothrix schenckii 1099-18 TaxID=1397361 RepID=A0A0F2M5Q2_SPOSC|nr:uncharacterized protein SPSK_04734 [Sporothrix schenckii 1099-18]KJR83511.1 hypothetical protein SPSK_04734 [Sporothrix schenckii 1099-18]